MKKIEWLGLADHLRCISEDAKGVILSGGEKASSKAARQHLVWRLHVHAKRKESAERILDRLSDVLDTEIQVQSLESHEKASSTFILSFRTEVPFEGVADAVLYSLLIAQRVAAGWTVAGPFIHDDDSWSFEMVCAEGYGRRFKVPGVFWISMTTGVDL